MRPVYVAVAGGSSIAQEGQVENESAKPPQERLVERPEVPLEQGQLPLAVTGSPG